MRPSRDLAFALPGRAAPSWAYLPAGSPWRGSLAVSSQVSGGNPARGPGLRAGEGSPGGWGARSRSSAFGARGRAAGRCVSSRVVRLGDSGSPAPLVAFRGAPAGLQRPGPHFMPQKPMRRLKTLRDSGRRFSLASLFAESMIPGIGMRSPPAPPPRPPLPAPLPPLSSGRGASERDRGLGKAGSPGALRTGRCPRSEQAPPFKIQIRVLRAGERPGCANRACGARPGEPARTAGGGAGRT